MKGVIKPELVYFFFFFPSRVTSFIIIYLLFQLQLVNRENNKREKNPDLVTLEMTYLPGNCLSVQ